MKKILITFSCGILLTGAHNAAVGMESEPCFIETVRCSNEGVVREVREMTSGEYSAMYYFDLSEHQKDVTKARDFAKKALEENPEQPIPAFILAEIYKNGEGVTSDMQSAIRYYEQVVDSPCDSLSKTLDLREKEVANYELGCIYMNGLGVPKNLELAIHYLRNSDVAMGKILLGDYYFDNGNKELAMSFYEEGLRYPMPKGVDITKHSEEYQIPVRIVKDFSSNIGDISDRRKKLEPEVWFNAVHRYIMEMKSQKKGILFDWDATFLPRYVCCTDIMDVLSSSHSPDEMSKFNRMYGELLCAVTDFPIFKAVDEEHDTKRDLLKQALELGNSEAALKLIDTANEDIEFSNSIFVLHGVKHLSREENIRDIVKYTELAISKGVDKDTATEILRKYAQTDEVLTSLIKISPDKNLLIKLFDLRISNGKYAEAKSLMDAHPEMTDLFNAWLESHADFLANPTDEVLTSLIKISPDESLLAKLFNLRMFNRKYAEAKSLMDSHPEMIASFNSQLKSHVEYLVNPTRLVDGEKVRVTPSKRYFVARYEDGNKNIYSTALLRRRVFDEETANRCTLDEEGERLAELKKHFDLSSILDKQ